MVGLGPVVVELVQEGFYGRSNGPGPLRWQPNSESFQALHWDPKLGPIYEVRSDQGNLP